MVEYMPFIWIGFAVIMAVCEAFTSQLVSIWFVLGGICAAVTCIFTDSIAIQTTVFLLVSLIALALTRPIVKKLKSQKAVVNTNADRLIGRIGTVTADIQDAHTPGQVKVEGEVWAAKSESAPIEKGTKIKVIAIEGVKLIVESDN